MSGEWEQVAENLVRHRSGVYYLRAKVLGKVIRVSLKTTSLRIAKIRRNDRLDAERSAAVARKPGDVRTMRDAIAVLRGEMVERPHVRPKTIAYAKDVIRILTETLPLDAHGRTWSAQEAGSWWARMTKRFSASVANKLLSAVKRLAGILIEHGIRLDDPTRALRRMPTVKRHRKMPGREEMTAVIDHIRRQKKRLCVESSRMVAVLAFSGMRVGELRALTWEDVGEEWITVGGDGETKGKRFRLVPVSAPLRAVLEVMRAECGTGPLFEMSSPRRALHTACQALKLPDMRVHDLRHFFATWCIESGVDMPTVAKWLGHSDGGALAMRTYGHVRDDHSLAEIKRLE